MCNPPPSWYEPPSGHRKQVGLKPDETCEPNNDDLYREIDKIRETERKDNV